MHCGCFLLFINGEKAANYNASVVKSLAVSKFWGGFRSDLTLCCRPQAPPVSWSRLAVNQGAQDLHVLPACRRLWLVLCIKALLKSLKWATGRLSQLARPCKKTVRSCAIHAGLSNWCCAFSADIIDENRPPVHFPEHAYTYSDGKQTSLPNTNSFLLPSVKAEWPLCTATGKRQQQYK